MQPLNAALFSQPNLQLRVWFNDGVNGFAALSPVQNLTPAPYALEALNAGSASNLLGAVSASQVTGAFALAQLPAAVLTNNGASVVLNGLFTGGGAGLTNVNAASLNGLNASNLWQIGGNNVAAGQFLGSTNNQPLELSADRNRALRPRAGGERGRRAQRDWRRAG